MTSSDVAFSVSSCTFLFTHSAQPPLVRVIPPMLCVLAKWAPLGRSDPHWLPRSWGSQLPPRFVDQFFKMFPNVDKQCADQKLFFLVIFEWRLSNFFQLPLLLLPIIQAGSRFHSPYGPFWPGHNRLLSAWNSSWWRSCPSGKFSCASRKKARSSSNNSTACFAFRELQEIHIKGVSGHAFYLQRHLQSILDARVVSLFKAASFLWRVVKMSTHLRSMLIIKPTNSSFLLWNVPGSISYWSDLTMSLELKHCKLVIRSLPSPLFCAIASMVLSIFSHGTSLWGRCSLTTVLSRPKSLAILVSSSSSMQSSTDTCDKRMMLRYHVRMRLSTFCTTVEATTKLGTDNTREQTPTQLNKMFSMQRARNGSCAHFRPGPCKACPVGSLLRHACHCFCR